MSENEKKKGEKKTIIDAPRGDTTFKVYPEDVKIIGVDTPHKNGEHRLWQKRAFRPPNPDSVASMKRYGGRYVPAIDIELAPSGDPHIPEGAQCLSDGRGRIVDAREANRQREAEGLPRFQLRAFVKHYQNHEESIRRAVIPNAYATPRTQMDRVRDVGGMYDAGIAEEEIAAIEGVGVPQLKLWDVLAKASVEIQELVETGKIKMLAGVKMAQINPALQKRAIANAKAGKKVTVRDMKISEGKPLPPSRKDLKLVQSSFAAHVESAKKSERPALELALAVLKWSREGGDFPIPGIFTAPPAAPDASPPEKKARAKKPVDNETAELPLGGGAEPDGDDDPKSQVLEYGLSARGTRVAGGDKDEDTIVERLRSVGIIMPPADVSRYCRELAAEGKALKTAMGYRKVSE